MQEGLLVRTKQLGEQSRILDSLVKAGLTGLAGTFGKELSAALVASWTRALEGLAPAEILEGFKRVEKTFIPTSACPFPVPAHLRAQIDGAKDNAASVEAEAAWTKALSWAQRWYKPDCRNLKRPELETIVWRSLAAAGGPAHVSDCSLDDLAWAKKRFLEAYASLERLKRDQNFIGVGEAKQILADLVDEYTPKTIKAKVKLG